ncbi:MAG: hypothetical protein KatS3mg031_2931 [Chitinophagales bacterium]|nr:MAG: hypothetical protein KatS3mg031_2931 [Chitinophagales bacterium]
MENTLRNLFPKNIKTREQRLEWLVENKHQVIDQKKACIKHADPFYHTVSFVGEETANKALKEANQIKVRVVANTTNYFDSYADVHIPQLWNKSLKENRQHYLVREHNFSFDGVISDDVSVFVKWIPWRELGAPYNGSTQALIYDAVINKDNSAGMFDKYVQNKVRNHSVGMRYVKVLLAVNDPNYEEYENWEKYAPDVVNIEEAEQQGYFFAVLEAKNIEASAVLLGANPITPVLNIEEKQEKPVATTSHQKSMIITPDIVREFYNPKL